MIRVVLDARQGYPFSRHINAKSGITPLGLPRKTATNRMGVANRRTADDADYPPNVRMPIPGYEKIYEVDATGRVFSLERKVMCQRAGREFPTTVPARELRGHVDRYGYRVFSLCRDSQLKAIGAHRIVCMAFHGRPPLPGMHAAHADGMKLNNTPSNLSWATVAENNEQRRDHGVLPQGERLPHSKLTASAAIEIVARSRSGEPSKALARAYGVTDMAIRKVITGRSWRHATGLDRVPPVPRLNTAPSLPLRTGRAGR